MYYGKVQGKQTVCFAGRFHFYEGHAGPTLTLLPNLASALGCRVFVLTNAAGGTLPSMQLGCLMTIVEHASTSRFNPLAGYEAINCSHLHLTQDEAREQLGQAKYPFSTSAKQIYSAEIARIAQQIATDEGFARKTAFSLNGEDRQVKLYEATYLKITGPYYEAHASIPHIIKFCPGSVGMSSIPEALTARMLGMHVYGMSVVTDLCLLDVVSTVTHEQVKQVADKVSNAVQALVSQLVHDLDVDKLAPIEPWGKITEDFQMIEETTGYASWEDAEHQAAGLKGAKHAIIYPDVKFSMYVDKETLFVSAPKTVTQY